MPLKNNNIETRDGSGDRTHQKLMKTIEKRQHAYLWTPKHTITFIPRLLPTIFGDGRALFTISTINQRPAYWVVRGCSTWGCGLDRDASPGLDIVDIIDILLTDLEEHFGRGRCSESGSSLFRPKKERMINCQCEECSDRYSTAKWPMVDDHGGCSWSRIDWPLSFNTIPNPLSSIGNLLKI